MKKENFDLKNEIENKNQILEDLKKNKNNSSLILNNNEDIINKQKKQILELENLNSKLKVDFFKKFDENEVLIEKNNNLKKKIIILKKNFSKCFLKS